MKYFQSVCLCLSPNPREKTLDGAHGVMWVLPVRYLCFIRIGHTILLKGRGRSKVQTKEDGLKDAFGDLFFVNSY